MEEKQQQVLENRVVNVTTWQFDRIKMGHAVSSFKGLTRFSGGNEEDVIRLHFGLKGDYRFLYKQLNKTYDLVGSHHNLMYSQGFDITVENKTTKIETFGIQFPKELFLQFTRQASDGLQRFSEAVMAGRNSMLSEHWGVINPAIQQVIQQVIHCKYAGDLKRLFLLSKSIELLVLSADAYEEAAAKKDVFIKSPTDKEKLVAVRDLINERVTCPPNLSEIALTVGLNEYKLKRGFKEMFNTTVFGYLAERRMQLAHQYLLDTAKTAAEIAYELGFATPQHFNNAFKKKYGITPSSVRNNP